MGSKEGYVIPEVRLKELEALEKIVEKIDKLTVFGGLDGVLKQLVNLKT